MTRETISSYLGYLHDAYPVSYTHLDVYKRQERGITEPTPTFSACFGAAFLSLHPTKYAEELVKKMNKVGAKAYLVNTGWNGSGKRISIKEMCIRDSFLSVVVAAFCEPFKRTCAPTTKLLLNSASIRL